jgi:hypothetical protein
MRGLIVWNKSGYFGLSEVGRIFLNKYDAMQLAVKAKPKAPSGPNSVDEAKR